MGANTQLQSTEQSARAMEEMTVGVGRITETAQEVTDQSDQVTKGVENGYEEIEAAISQMNIIGESVNSTALEIKEMEKHSEQIGQVVDVISKISRQTELLALNASIEAARAGEHGRGFAVVANEVKKLAEQTNESVSNVVTIISAIQQLMKNASEAVDQNITDIGEGISSIQGVGKTFDQIRSTIRGVNAQMQDISATTEELSAGAEEISASVVEMTSTAKESASNAEAIAASSEQQNVLINNVSQSFNELNDLMDELKKLIDVFKV
ncbi:putative methyl-accepting chemotaxis protein YoaH [compost metagenome]